MKRMTATLTLVIGLVVLGFGLASPGVTAGATTTSPEAMAAEQCPNPPYTKKIDSDHGTATGEGYTFTFTPTELTYEVDAGTTLHICVKAGTQTYEFTFVGPDAGTLTLEDFDGKEISHVSYYVTTTPVTSTTSTTSSTTSTTSTVPVTSSTTPVTTSTIPSTTTAAPPTDVPTEVEGGVPGTGPTSGEPTSHALAGTGILAGLGLAAAGAIALMRRRGQHEG